MIPDCAQEKQIATNQAVHRSMGHHGSSSHIGNRSIGQSQTPGSGFRRQRACKGCRTIFMGFLQGKPLIYSAFFIGRFSRIPVIIVIEKRAALANVALIKQRPVIVTIVVTAPSSSSPLSESSSSLSGSCTYASSSCSSSSSRSSTSSSSRRSGSSRSSSSSSSR